MSRLSMRFRRLGVGTAIAIWVVALASQALPGQSAPAPPKEDKSDGSKKGTKGAAVVKLSVDVTAAGAALSDALVLVTSPGYSDTSSTNANGKAHFSDVPRAKTKIQTTALGYITDTREEDLSASGPEHDVKITLVKK